MEPFVDDLGAVVVIAVFYTDQIQFLPLSLAGLSFLVMIVFNRVGIHMMHEKLKAILQNIKDKIDAVGSPAARLEHDLHLPVSLIVIPLFALANAGISIDFSSISNTIFEPVSIGIIAGLIIGKVLGIAGVAWLAIKLKIAKLPEGSNMSQIFGVAFLGGIGFTMSIFVADLAFLGNDALIFQAKVGILAASLFAGLFGYIWLRYIANSNK